MSVIGCRKDCFFKFILEGSIVAGVGTFVTCDDLNALPGVRFCGSGS